VEIFGGVVGQEEADEEEDVDGGLPPVEVVADVVLDH